MQNEMEQFAIFFFNFACGGGGAWGGVMSLFFGFFDLFEGEK